jgi:molecular chaperone HscC
MIDDPNVASRFKREMGTDKVYSTSWGKYTPTQLSTMVLRKLKAETEKVARSTIDAAVVTIPANFSNEAVKRRWPRPRQPDCRSSTS